MSEPKATVRSDFLADLLAQEGSEGLDALGAASNARAPQPSATGRARLLAAATHVGRFWRFDAQVAALLDLGRDAARKVLDLIDLPDVWQHPMAGASLFWVDGGPRMQEALCGFLRVSPGKVFPEHEHLGEETVLVLSGIMLDPETGKLTRPGEIDRRPHGSRHVVAVPADGLDLLMLAVVHGGLRVRGVDFTPRNVVRRGL